MRCRVKLPRYRMLKVRAEISRSFKYGVKFKGKYLTLIKVPEGIIRHKPGEPTAQYPKFAVLVRKKCGNAVRRNRLKRQVREFYRLNQNDFSGCEAVLFSLEKEVRNENDFKAEMRKIAKEAFPGENPKFDR